jgi:hypothetical protein
VKRYTRYNAPRMGKGIRFLLIFIGFLSLMSVPYLYLVGELVWAIVFAIVGATTLWGLFTWWHITWTQELIFDEEEF